MKDQEMTIGALARRAGVKTSALRYYEDIGLLAPKRRISGRRRYDETAAERLRVIQLAQRCGFTLAEIQRLMADFDRGLPSAQWNSMARAKIDELEEQLDRVARMRALLLEGLDCQCLDLRACARLAGEP